MPRAEPKPRLNGENVRVTIFVGGTPHAASALAKSVTIEPRVTEHDDAFLGSDADDPDQQIRGWTFKIELFKTDAVLEKALLDREAKRIARQTVPDVSIGLVFENRDGTSDAFVLQKCEAKPLSTNSSGAAERVMNTLDGRAKYYRSITL